MKDEQFMSNQQLLEIYNALPYRFKCQVQHLIIHLIIETREAGVNLDQIEKLGVIMADDFNAPMKEFHDYMYNMDIDFLNKIEKLPLKFQNEIEGKVDELLKRLEVNKA